MGDCFIATQGDIKRWTIDQYDVSLGALNISFTYFLFTLFIYKQFYQIVLLSYPY